MNHERRKFIPDSEIERAVQCAVASIKRRKDFGILSEEDLFQEGMIFAIERMGEYRKDFSTVMTFLFRPVKTHLDRLIHKEALSSGLLLPENEKELEEIAKILPQYPDVIQAFSYESDLALKFDLQETLDKLPQKERELVIDRFMNGVKLKELAARNYVSESAMHRRITKVIEKMRIYLGDKYASN